MLQNGKQLIDVKIAICDDIPQDTEVIRACTRELMENSGIRCEIDLFDCGEAMLERVKTGDVRYDLCFIDVLMGGINGIETANGVKALARDCKIVFVTNSHEFAVEAFSLNALHYLIKPITKEQLAEAFRRYSAESLRSYITVFDGIDQVKIFLDNILYLESSHDNNTHSNTYIITKSCRIMARNPLSEMAQMLGENFLKLHRGLIVNMDFIERMGADRCVLKSGTVEILARGARGEIRERYKNYLSNRVRVWGADL